MDVLETEEISSNPSVEMEIDKAEMEVEGENPLHIPGIQMRILKLLKGRDILTCRKLSTDFVENCQKHLCSDNKILIRLELSNIRRFLAEAEEFNFSEFITGGQSVVFEILDVDMKEEIYHTFFSVCPNPRIRRLAYVMQPSAVEKLISLLLSSYMYFESLVFTRPLIMMGPMTISSPMSLRNVDAILKRNPLNCKFLKLKSIEITQNRIPNIYLKILIKLITSAPVLEKLTIAVNNQLGVGISNGISCKLKILDLDARSQDPITGLTGENLFLLLHRVAPSLEKFTIKVDTHEQITALGSINFPKVIHLDLSTSVFVHFNRINPRTFPVLKRFDFVFGPSSTPQPNPENHLALFPNSSVEELTLIIHRRESASYTEDMIHSLESLSTQFPRIKHYKIHEEQTFFIFPHLCSSRNPHIKDIQLFMNGKIPFPQENFTGVRDEKLHLLQDFPTLEDDKIRDVPSVADIPNLEAFEICTMSWRRVVIPCKVVTHGLVRIKKLKKLCLPRMHNLFLYLGGNNGKNLEKFIFQGCYGEKLLKLIWDALIQNEESLGNVDESNDTARIFHWYISEGKLHLLQAYPIFLTEDDNRIN